MLEYSKHDILRFLTIVFIILFNTYYLPIDGRGGMGPIRYAMMGLAVAMLPFCFKISKAVIFGFIYLATQYLAAIFHPESIRWTTLLYSAELILTYISLYHLIYVEKVFTIDLFIKIIRWLMIVYFGVFITQQLFMLIGIRVFPLINMTYDVQRGFGCYSLSMEPSTFARTMLVCYYAYIKCHEYKRGSGPFSLRELFSKEHRFITIIFLWMMCTMGSGTAFVCLIGLAAYFVRWNNWYYIVPILLLMYFIVLPAIHVEQLNRATRITTAMTTFDQSLVEEADGSGASRISPLLNSLNADFTKKETWFGYGVDYGRRNNTFVKQTGTLFDDYGVLFFIAYVAMNLACGYRFKSLAFLFCLMGVGGGTGTNIHYAYGLMILMTCVRYFYENRFNLSTNEQGTKTDAETFA